MEEKLNLDDIFTDIADAIREKTKTTDKIKTYDMGKKIKEISGSVDIVKPIYIEQKNPIPNTGFVKSIYFNTNLTTEQVDLLIKNANLNFIDPGIGVYIYPILSTSSTLIVIIDFSSDMGVERGAYWAISDFASNKSIYLSPAVASEIDGGAGWYSEAFSSFDDGEISIEAEAVETQEGLPIGSQNNLLTDLVCIPAMVDSGEVEILKTLKDQYKLVENSLEFDGSKSTSYDYDFISNINEATKEINVITNITVNAVSTFKKYLDYKKSVYGMFGGDSNITFDELNEILSYDDTSNITDMARMFGGCSNLTSIPLLNTSNVTDMARMFYDCYNLTSIPLLDTSSVTNMSYMFYNCSNLTSIPLLNTSNVTDMNNMFYGCSNLTATPQLNTNKVTYMHYMFKGCSSLTKIDLTDMKTTNTYYSDEMFMNCYSLTKLIIRNMSSVPSLNSNVFTNCYHFTGTTDSTYNPNGLKDGRIYVPDDMVNTLKSATNWSTYADIIVPLSTLEE